MFLETTNQTNCTNKIVFKEESFHIIGACFEVYNELGNGFLEAVYQEALALEFHDQLIPFIDQQLLQLKYKSHNLQTLYKPDFICFGKIILEIKAVRRLTDEHRSQVHNYLKATGFKLGLLVNFGQHPKVVHERIVR
ncbi:MAG: GxxExxY protein [Bythopirellula sp.]|nr:GxxExxY protein [Bythopirellula sp.]